MYKIFNHLLATAVLEEFRPCCSDALTLDIVVDERIIVQVKRWAHIHVEAADTREQKQANDRIDPCGDDGALAQSEVPNLNQKKVLEEGGRILLAR